MATEREARRALVGETARALIATGTSKIDSIRALEGAPTALRARAKKSAQNLLSEIAEAELRQMPTSALKSALSRGTRLGALENSRFRSVADIAAASPGALTAVPGIGATSAKDIYAAARGALNRARASAVIRFDPARQTEDQTELLRTLVAIRRADAVEDDLQLAAAQIGSQIAPLLTASVRATSRAKMFFSSPSKRQSAIAAVTGLQKLLEDQTVQRVTYDMEQSVKHLDPDSNAFGDVWPEYRTNAAVINSLLSIVLGSSPPSESNPLPALGHIPPDLAQQIQTISLRTELLKSPLRGYQVFGAQFAIHQEKSILGDEMGVGKTIQAIAHAADLASDDPKLCYLVVCPASVLINWTNEVRKHSHLLAYTLHGNFRQAAVHEWKRKGGFGITTYGTLDRLSMPADLHIALLVVDEAHFIKNPQALRTQAVRRVIGRADRVMFMTGTPMENRVDEFRNLVSYLQPAIAARMHGIQGARDFRRSVAPVYLRRNQADVLRELPEKIEVDDWVTPSARDEVMYRDAVSSRNFMAMRQAAFASGSESAKLGRVLEIVDESASNGRKVLIFSFFLGVLKRIGDSMPDLLAGT